MRFLHNSVFVFLFLFFFFLGLISSGVKTTVPVFDSRVDLLCLGSSFPAEEGSGSDSPIRAMVTYRIGITRVMLLYFSYKPHHYPCTVE